MYRIPMRNVSYLTTNFGPQDMHQNEEIYFINYVQWHFCLSTFSIGYYHVRIR